MEKFMEVILRPIIDSGLVVVQVEMQMMELEVGDIITAHQYILFLQFNLSILSFHLEGNQAYLTN